jgi:PPK2 family polyphosphate:nucleotide phosphotransferase
MKITPKKLSALAEPYCIEHGAKFRLKDVDPAENGKAKIVDQADAWLAAGLEQMQEHQEKLYAQEHWSLLLIFQAMDAAGKDGTIKHVMSGLNPQGCRVTSFKTPSTLEQNHDFLWRANLALPERGQIGIFNRSYYEETLIVRVHKQMLDAEHLPPKLRGKHLWRDRFEDIRAYERYLSRNGTKILKFFLHISKGEQKKRFLARLDEPAKNWKFSTGDLKERAFWDDYQDVYEEMIQATATPHAPWYVVPANDKDYAHLIVAGAVIAALDSLPLAFPKVSPEQKEALARARQQLAN